MVDGQLQRFIFYRTVCRPVNLRFIKEAENLFLNKEHFRKEAEQGLRLFKVATTTAPPGLVTRKSSLIAQPASRINSMAVTETVLSKELFPKGRSDISPLTR